MDEQTSQSFAQAAGKALATVQASQEPSTTPSTTSEAAHKRHFLQTFRRWEMLFKRKDGDVESDKWLIAEYYKSLGHLSEAGLDTLTDILKERCVFFPTVKECLDAARFSRWDYTHPLRLTAGAYRTAPPERLTAPVKQIEGW